MDQMYQDIANRLMEEGFWDKDLYQGKVRPVWEDGQPAYSKYLAQEFFSYSKGLVPLNHFRKTAWKTAIREILWIYQDRSNDVNLLKKKHKVHYWDAWQNEEGNLGTAYGYQIDKEFLSPETGQKTNQIQRLIDNLKNDPANRRHFMTLLDMDDLHSMTLIPCAFMTLWTVTDDYLNMTLIQRSGDFLAAASPGGINAFQYYALMAMVSQVTGYKPGKFLHFIQNIHIYDRHIPLLQEVLQAKVEEKKQPKLLVNPKVQDFQDFTIKDFKLVDYDPDRRMYQIPIAL